MSAPRKLSARFYTLPLLIVASLVPVGVAYAFDASAYYPLEVGILRSYETKKHSEIKSGLEERKNDKHGTIDEEIVGPSRFSGNGTSVYKVRVRVEEHGSSIAPVVNLETMLHVSADEAAVRVHGIDGTRNLQPTVLLGYPISDEPRRSQVAGMQLHLTTTSQTKETVTVPAGKFPNALKQVSEGPVYGNIGAPIRDGTIVQTTWFARGVGVVREDRRIALKVQTPEGRDVLITEESTKRLTRFSKPAKAKKEPKKPAE
ncbi:MAG: hypothetical protein AAGF92_01620 [Myxococcota bacterium]